ncbi:MAG TPA: bifunctional phosphoribosylaminoimidazolecarboxamide formyltransferase/IMP cyclohydrolase [Nitrospiria bacterium]|nr:bifunctional phosphoribosylaminoimidazolecarboxamide formyltransferase/IMP cyclohydrolase [Nitrospiria bacterium]
MKIQRALISVSNKEGVVELAKGLTAMGVEILSTGGTSKALKEAGIPVKDVADFTGFPEMLDGRVKTLHPKIHGGLLARRDDPTHLAQMKQQGLEPIDLVAVNLYPFEATVAKPDVRFEEAIENIDIGGPAMLRSSAKNFEHVTVIVDPRDYPRVLEELRSNKGTVSRETRLGLARKVFNHTARYDSVISAYLENRVKEADRVRFPGVFTLQVEKVEDLRYGENPHQQAAFYREFHLAEPSISTAKQLHGKAMSFNNFLDANAGLELAKEFDRTAAVIIKHNNPCGVATGETLLEAYTLARTTDPISAFGGVIAFNRPVDVETAEEIAKMFVEIVIAPGFERGALDVFKKKKDLRLLDVGPDLNATWERRGGMDMKRVVGGLILQDRDLGRIDDPRKLKVVTKRKPTEEEYDAMAFAWIVCKHVKSNAIVYAKPGRTIGIGAGQMSRVDSVKIAIMKAQSSLSGAVMASDAFFPFRDGLDEAAKAGIRAVIQPGGSIKDEEVIRAADEHDMAMVMTGMRHFRH